MFDVTDSDFEEKVIKKSMEIPVVVDFWAEWCPPCRMLGPVLEEIAGKYKGRFVLAKLNVDDNHGKSMEFRISSIPAVKMFKNGKIADEFVGAMPEESIRKWLDKNLK